MNTQREQTERPSDARELIERLRDALDMSGAHNKYTDVLGLIEAADAYLAGRGSAEPVAMTAEQRLAAAGVFKGAHGLRGLLEHKEFWADKPHETRLYYGDGIMDYLHRGVLRTAVELLDAQPTTPQPPTLPELTDEDVVKALGIYAADWLARPRELTDMRAAAECIRQRLSDRMKGKAK